MKKTYFFAAAILFLSTSNNAFATQLPYCHSSGSGIQKNTLVANLGPIAQTYCPNYNCIGAVNILDDRRCLRMRCYGAYPNPLPDTHFIVGCENIYGQRCNDPSVDIQFMVGNIFNLLAPYRCDDSGWHCGSCVGRVCGSDGCGGTCGSCPPGRTCNASGQCVTSGGGNGGGSCNPGDDLYCDDDEDCFRLEERGCEGSIFYWEPICTRDCCPSSPSAMCIDGYFGPLGMGNCYESLDPPYNPLTSVCRSCAKYTCNAHATSEMHSSHVTDCFLHVGAPGTFGTDERGTWQYNSRCYWIGETDCFGNPGWSD